MEKLALLFVEEDEADRRAFGHWLEAAGYGGRLAGSLAEAQQLLAANRFDAIISEYGVGDGTAFDLFEVANKTPLIIVTGAGDETIAVEAIKAGAADYLIKDGERRYLEMLPRVVANAVQHARDVAARRKAERRGAAFANLAQQLNPITSPKEAAQIIVAVADQLLGWDASWLRASSSTSGSTSSVSSTTRQPSTASFSSRISGPERVSSYGRTCPRGTCPFPGGCRPRLRGTSRWRSSSSMRKPPPAPPPI